MDVDLGLFTVHFSDGEVLVLILVLVDVGLGQFTPLSWLLASARLNPCFSGCWSRTVQGHGRT